VFRVFQMKKAATFTAVSVLVLGLTACSSGSPTSSENSTDGRAEELKIQFVGPPVSMDPALAGSGGSTTFVSLAYDPLIYLSAEGELVPALATSWGFADTENKVFEVKLREGVSFASGSALTAEAAKASMDYFLKTAGPNVGQAGPVASIEAVDPTTLRITYSAPFPNAAASLTQYFMFGNIIGPEGLADPASLLTSTDGAGQYQFNEDESVAESSYMYERNPSYWAPEAQMYESVSVQVIADANATLSAISTGQVDFAAGNSTTLESATAEGLEVVKAPFFNWSLFLADKEGQLNPALQDERVRKAIAMSIDREAVAAAVGSEVSTPNGQPMNAGTSGYVEGIDFEYDLEEAKKLMAEAGYEDGFDLSILTQSTIDPQALRSQAIESSIEQLGINVELEVVGTGIANFTTESLSKKYEAVIFPLTGSNMGEVYASLQGGLRDPFGVPEPELAALYEKSLTASEDDRVEIYEEMSTLMNESAWVIPVFSADNISYVGPEVTNVKASALNPNPTPVGPAPEYAWQPAS
jgi:peptide/nickel transport system substrate-binding protein